MEQLKALDNVVKAGKVGAPAWHALIANVPCLFQSMPAMWERKHASLADRGMRMQVRYIGVSNETSYGVMRFVQLAEQLGLPKIVSIQNSYSLLVRTAFETDLAEVCAPRQANVGLLAYSPLAGYSPITIAQPSYLSAT